jgi:hypothetical protein
LNPLHPRADGDAVAAGFKKRFPFSNHSEDAFELFDLEADPSEKNNLATTQPEVLSQLKQKFQVWNSSVQASFEGKDYAEGKVTPPDPEPINWFDAAPYQPWLTQWSDYWAYQAYLNRPGNGLKGKGKGKGKKSQ